MAGKLPHHREQCSNARAEIVKILAGLGANMDAENYKGLTPLHLAVQANNAVLIKALVDAGADLNAIPSAGCLLHLAAFEAETKTIELLLDLGADCCAVDSNGRTPLHCAAAAGRIDVFNLLINRGADINATDSSGATPILMAEQDDYP